MVRFALLLCALAAAHPAAGAIAVTRHQQPIPKDVAPAIAQLIAGDSGVRAEVDKVTLDFWFVKTLPTKSGTWAGVEEGTLVGAVQISGAFRDIRGRSIKPGLFTLRYGIQPSDGDHLGVSPFREFLLLSPAATDKDPAPKGHEALVELSKGTIGGSHPAVWSIDPPSAGAAPLSLHKTELGHEAFVVEVPAASAPFRFGIVLVGKIEA